MIDPLTWKSYSEWRRTKCPQRDLSDLVQRNEEITQATLEFIGEVAEVTANILWNSENLRTCDGKRNIINECGDAIFCGSWVIDSWNQCKLIDRSDLRISNVNHEGESLLELAAEASRFSGELANRLKKHKYQGKEQDPSLMASYTTCALLCIQLILEVVGSSVEEALRMNIDKLNRRYPNGFQTGGGIRE